MNKKTFGFRGLQKASNMVKRMDAKLSYRRLAYQYDYTPQDVKARIKRIGGGYQGSDAEFRDTVVKYWSRYGVKPPRAWYALYCNGKDAYDPRFIPDPIWFERVLPYFNRKPVAGAYADKGIYSFLLRDVKKPDTIVKNMGGYYYDGDGDNLISREEAERICRGEEHLICKPSMGTKGAGILFYDRDDENSRSITAIFDAMKSNFVVQRIVKQHPDLARLNPSTLNTVRVISFHFKGEVHILSAQLRIGGAGARVDNVSAGGCACAIKPDGWLQGQSVNRQSTWTDETPGGIKLNTIRIPNYEGVIETIKRLHVKLPYFNIVGWDFAVDQDGEPVFVEFNTRPGQNQIGGREPTFGDMTDEVLEDVFIKKTLKDAFKR